MQPIYGENYVCQLQMLNDQWTMEIGLEDATNQHMQNTYICFIYTTIMVIVCNKN